MKSDYYWGCVALIASVLTEAERIGSWSEGCPCPEHQIDTAGLPKIPGRKRRRQRQQGRTNHSCPLKCCHAPELAVGSVIGHQEMMLKMKRAQFAQYIAQVPPAKQAELHASFDKSSGLLWGIWAKLREVIFAVCFSFCCLGHVYISTYNDCSAFIEDGAIATASFFRQKPRTHQHQASVLEAIALVAVSCTELLIIQFTHRCSYVTWSRSMCL